MSELNKILIVNEDKDVHDGDDDSDNGAEKHLLRGGGLKDDRDLTDNGPKDNDEKNNAYTNNQ
eukprot:8839760-Ditylum_brightwellii.AAC.1